MASGEAAAGAAPAGETPTGETPAGETPAAETPAAETPAGSAPAGAVPAGIRLRRTLRPRLRRGHLLAGVLCALLGFAAVVQIQANSGTGLAGLRQSDLVRILDDTAERTRRLEEEARNLEAAGARLRAGPDAERAAQEETQRQADILGILAGTVPARGPGVQLHIPDPHAQVPSDVLLDTVQELRDAGAEAVQVNSVRVGVSTWFLDADPGINIDGTVVRPPYDVRAIGDPRTLTTALDIPGGILEVLRQQYDVAPLVRSRSVLVVDALRAPKTPQYARPAQQAPTPGG